MHFLIKCIIFLGSFFAFKKLRTVLYRLLDMLIIETVRGQFSVNVKYKHLVQRDFTHPSFPLEDHLLFSNDALQNHTDKLHKKLCPECKSLK